MSTLAKGRILVTGGAGFIGSALVWALNQRGYTDIVVIDFLAPGKTWRGEVAVSHGAGLKRLNLAPLKFAQFVEADSFRSRIARNANAFGRFGTVLHLGACSATTETNAAYLDDNNFACTKEMVVWSLAQGARFVYASSAATYGNGSAGMDDKSENLAALHPLNLYGQSKHNFDLYAQKNGLLRKIVRVKYFNVYGLNEGHKGDMCSIVNKVFEQINSTGRLKLFKSHRHDCRDGEQKRDFLYVKDAIEMALHFCEKATTIGSLFNLGSGKAHTWLELADTIFDAIGKPVQIDFIDMPEQLRDKLPVFHASGHL